MAYVHAVAALAGFNFEFLRVDNDSVDVSIKARGKLQSDSIYLSPQIDIQLKSSSQIETKGNYLHFPLPLKNYNDLRVKHMVPRYLVVLNLPVDKTEWLILSSEQLVMKKCAYFLSIMGEEETINTSTVTVKIPEVNLFTPSTLHNLLVNASKFSKLK